MRLIEYINNIIDSKKKIKNKICSYKLKKILYKFSITNKKFIYKEICESLNIPYVKWYYILNNINDLRYLKLKNDNSLIIKSDRSSCCDDIYHRIPNKGYFKLNNGKKINKNSILNSYKLKYANIIIEEYLEDKYYKDLNDESEIKRLTDFKLYYFYGNFYFFKIYNENVSKKYNIGPIYYDYNWNQISIDDDNIIYMYNKFTYKYNKWEIEEMKRYSKNIYDRYMKNVPFVRFDFYVTTTGIKFGEITYTNDKGHYSFILDRYLGNILNKNNVNLKMNNFIKYNKIICKYYKQKYKYLFKLKYIADSLNLDKFKDKKSKPNTKTIKKSKPNTKTIKKSKPNTKKEKPKKIKTMKKNKKDKSNWIVKFRNKYGNIKNLKDISKITNIPEIALRCVIMKGRNAYFCSGSPKHQSAKLWGIIRMYSYIMGGPSREFDKDITKKYNVIF